MLVAAPTSTNTILISISHIHNFVCIQILGYEYLYPTPKVTYHFLHFFLSFFTKLQYRSYRTIINIISSRAHRKEKEVSISIRHFLFFFANNKFDTIFLCRCSLLGGTFKLLLWICLFSSYFLRHWVRECFRIQVFCKLLCQSRNGKGFSQHRMNSGGWNLMRPLKIRCLYLKRKAQNIRPFDFLSKKF